MAHLLSSMVWRDGWRYLTSSSGQEGSSVLSTTPLGSMVGLACHDDHQKVKGFLPRHDSWGSVPHLMSSGGAVPIVVTWHILMGRFDAPFVCLSSFPLIFSFLCPVFELPFFFLSSSLSLLCVIVSLCYFSYNFLHFSFSGVAPLRYGFFSLSLFFVVEIICKGYWVLVFFFIFFIWVFRILPLLFFIFLGSMVDSSEVRILCPSISFLFTSLRASLWVSCSFCPLVEGFVFRGSSLSVVLTDLFPLLCQLVDWWMSK